MPFLNNIIEAETIEDAWRDALWCCVRNGYDYIVKEGSYQGQIRRQLDYLLIKINKPWKRPLAVSIPEHLPFPSPTSEDSIFSYYQSLMCPDVLPGQDYTYGQFLAEGIDGVIRQLNRSQGASNQITLTVGEPFKEYNDPPCLRVVDFKVSGGAGDPFTRLYLYQLYMHLFFRSWDLFAGLPENLGGLQIYKEFVHAHLDTFYCEDGPLLAYSSGAHVYEQYFPLVNQLCVDTIEIGRGVEQ